MKISIKRSEKINKDNKDSKSNISGTQLDLSTLNNLWEKINKVEEDNKEVKQSTNLL